MENHLDHKMYIDSSFYNKLSELHRVKFNWATNNCGYFVGKMLKYMYNKDFLAEFDGKCIDQKSSLNIVSQNGGWYAILTKAGFSKRTDKAVYVGDVVICENAIGIYDGTKALFAGGTFRTKDKITDVYYYTNN